MYAIFHVTHDRLPKLRRFCFRSSADAKRFREFVDTFVIECPKSEVAGYRPYDDTIWISNGRPTEKTDVIDFDVCYAMLKEIATARLAGNEPTAHPRLVIDRRDEIIGFHFEQPLPPRLRPSVGDLAVIIDMKYRTDELATGHFRVCADYDNILEITAEPSKHRKKGQVTRFVPAGSVMKVRGPDHAAKKLQ